MIDPDIRGPVQGHQVTTCRRDLKHHVPDDNIIGILDPEPTVSKPTVASNSQNRLCALNVDDAAAAKKAGDLDHFSARGGDGGFEGRAAGDGCGCGRATTGCGTTVSNDYRELERPSWSMEEGVNLRSSTFAVPVPAAAAVVLVVEVARVVVLVVVVVPAAAVLDVVPAAAVVEAVPYI